MVWREWSLCLFCFFFFQAEDGIRDIGVTGVQTCALPISRASVRILPRRDVRAGADRSHRARRGLGPPPVLRGLGPNTGVLRVEERGLGDPSGNGAAVDLDDQVVARPRVGGLYVGHREHLADAVPHGAGGDAPDLPVPGHDRVLVLAGLGTGLYDLAEGRHVANAVDFRSGSSRHLALQGETDPAPIQTPLLKPQQSHSPDEIAFLEADPAREPHMEGGILFAYVRTVERQALLDA